MKNLMILLLSFLFFTACGHDNTPQISSNFISEESNEIEEVKEEPILVNNPIFKTFHTGFGTALTFPFLSKNNTQLNIELKTLLLDVDIQQNSLYQEIKNINISSFEKLQEKLQQSKFLVFWLTENWEESWFNKDKVQELMDVGYIPIFSYWYFGDKLIYGIPSKDKVARYKQDNIKLAHFLSQLKGEKMLIIEPEFNKSAIVKDIKTQEELTVILSNAIDTIKDENPEDLLISISIMDKGIRGAKNHHVGCGYVNCALGDKMTWSNSETVINGLIDKLDFISFHQMIGSFSRDYTNLGGWDTPNPRNYSDDEIGIDYLANRIANLSKFLHEKYKKPIFMPFISIATATWDDSNQNKKIEENEVFSNGWESKATYVYSELEALKPLLQENGMFGFAVMSLFDNPRQDYGGYQYFMNNEYHLGVIGSGAKDEVDIAPDGDLYFKGDILEYLFNNEEK